MKRETLSIICCPNCRHEITLHESKMLDNEIINGFFKCRECGKSFTILNGVPRMVVNMGSSEDLAKSWGYEWTKIAEGKLETDTYYGGTESEELAGFFNYLGISADDLKGKKVLDAGCGCGRLTKAISKYGAQVIGIDIATSIERIINYSRPEPNVDIIQADIMTPPFPDASFDYVFCKLALNFVPRPEETFKTISRLVKPEGRLFISLPDKADPAFTLRLKEQLRITHRIPKWLLFNICWGLAPVLWLGRKLSRKPADSLRTNVFLLFTAWHSKFTLHTREEVITWFKEDNFKEIMVVPDTHTVNVRGTKPSLTLG